MFIIGKFFFPKGNAAGKYNLGYALMLKEIGYEPIVIGTDPHVDDDREILGTVKEDYGIKHYRMPHPNYPIDWAKVNSQFTRVKTVFSEYDLRLVKSIIVFSSPAFSLWSSKLRRWAEKKRIPFIAHCAEWIRFTKRGFFYSLIRGIDDVFQQRCVVKRADGVIVGGPLLRDYFVSKGCKVLMMPTITDMNEHRGYVRNVLSGSAYQPPNSVRAKRFVYVGVPFDIVGNQKRTAFKDRLDTTIEVFCKVLEKNTNFKFEIFGLTAADYLRKVPEHKELLTKLGQHVRFNGAVSHSQAVRAIADSDFFIFHRDSTKITEAAFPTKVSEAISLAVPVVTTKTSNIFDYLVHGQTGFMITKENGPEMIQDLLNLQNSDVLHLRKTCAKVQAFDFRYQASRLEEFIHDVRDSVRGV